MNGRPRPVSWRATVGALVAVAVLAASCGWSSSAGTPTSPATRTAVPGEQEGLEDAAFSGTLRVGAIPDQDPEILQRSYDRLAGLLEVRLPGVSVRYVPVTDYQGAVSGFRAGDLDLVWFGGLTGVQARLEVPGAEAILRRDMDGRFTSVFITRPDSGLAPMAEVSDLSAVAGRSLTFGSESSTSGRLMPQHFLARAGVDVASDLDGPPGFSGSHDATIELVRAGAYDVGAVNSQVWDARLADGSVDETEVVEIFRTPPYADYHWVVQPGLDARFGSGFRSALIDAFTALEPEDPTEAEVLAFFGADAFVPTTDDDYDDIEAVAREIGAIRR